MPRDLRSKNFWPGRGPNLPRRLYERQLAYPNYDRLTQQYAEAIDTGDPALQLDRLTQQYAETINTGSPTLQLDRLTQQYAEAINTGDLAIQKDRLTQQYLEVIIPYPNTDPTNTFFMVM